MKKLTVLTFAALTAAVAFAGNNNPDSVYIRPSYRPGQMHCQIDYSIDGKHWTNIGKTIFDSDYGPWGSEKKLYNVVLSYDGKKYHAEFTPSPDNNPQIAQTEADCLYLWKPQDYPTLSQKDFDAKKAELAAASKNNVIRVPFRDVQALIDQSKIASVNFKMESEDFIQTSKNLTAGMAQVNSRLTINSEDSKAISPDLYGIFFEDISYAADGGLYAELVQNRDFEYTGDDHRGWNAQTAWKLEGSGSDWYIATDNPIHKNNSHYTVLGTDKVGAKLVNEGFDGILLKKGEKYNLSLFLRGTKSKVKVSLVSDGKELASKTFSTSENWKQQKAVLVPSADADKAMLVVEPQNEGVINIDFVSLFPQDTYKGHANGLRKDLAETIADLKPRFVRFPGGCASHGQGIDNIYHWQATVGDLWERQPDMNIWSYHQSRGLGFYEYFQFCEDMGAEALPVLAAGVPCQNSWKGGNGQQGGIPFESELGGKPSPYNYMGKPLTMESYLQELLDLIEWANGDAKTSKLAQMRAKAGHPKTFNLKYLGIGNEDLISDVFLKRYLFLIDGVRKAHPEITIVGTVGPFWEGSDYEYGWTAARKNNIPIVDEHYYNPAPWFVNHQDFYDNYDRKGTKVYLGEWASKGNNTSNALAEAIYLTNVERNADVVVMSSYAPLLAKDGHTNWNPDMIYFNNKEIKPTANYFVHSNFGKNAGDEYIYSSLSTDIKSAEARKLTNASVVKDSKSGDLIVKVVSILPIANNINIEIPESVDLSQYESEAELTVYGAGENPNKEREWKTSEKKKVAVASNINVNIPAYSFAIMRMNKKVVKK